MRIHGFELLLTFGTGAFSPRVAMGPLHPRYGADPLARPCPIDEIFVIGESNFPLIPAESGDPVFLMLASGIWFPAFQAV
jgi:hypothetical protein